jgi:Ca2+-transporting ATPase
VPLEDAWRAEVDARFDELASQGYRLLAAAYRPLAESFVPEEAETALTFIGVVAMMDPPKAGVAEAVAEAKGAGIRPVMITGDHILTAQAIGREVGITGEALQGLDVARMDDAELAAAVEEVEIFARTSPEHKVRIVNALLDLGHTVAVTGDGVNDAPVLKAADVGISMGIQGSDVAREAADLILTDDNFATIVAAVRYGRGIYDNLKNFFLFSLLGNFDELYLVIVAFLLGLPFPLTALQILWINLLTDAFAGLALAFEPPRAEVLHDKPRNPHASMLKPVIGRAATYGLLALIFELLFFLTGLGTSVAKARTLVFTFCVFFELVAIFSIRTEKRFDLKVQNRWLILAVVVSVVFQLVAIYSPLRHVLEVVPLTLGELGTVVGTSLLSYVLMEIVKLVILKRQKG